MGMFDSFDVKGLMDCPNCRTPIDELQTKEFECMLNNFKIGDKVAIAARCIIAHGYCDVCQNPIYSDILFDMDGRWIGYSKPRIKR
jgi:hypothetical protein